MILLTPKEARMKNNSRSTHSKSGLFLMELILVILFFSIAGAICIQIFVKAHLLSRSASELNRAVALAQSAAAGLEAGNGSLEDLALQFPEGILDTDTDDSLSHFTVYYDDAWKPCGKASAVYSLNVLAPRTAAPGTLNRESVVISRLGSQNSEIYRLAFNIYTPAAAKGGEG